MSKQRKSSRKKVQVTAGNAWALRLITTLEKLPQPATAGQPPKDRDWLPQLQPRHPSHREGHGVATYERLKHDGLVGKGAIFPPAVVVCEKGGRINAISEGLNLPPTIRNTHTLVVSKTGGGKSSKFILPMTLADVRAGKHVVFTDAKGDLIGPVREYVARHAPRAEFLCLDFTNASVSVGWNPFERGVTEEAAKELFEALLPPLGPHETSHFRNHEMRLASATAVALAAVLRYPVTLPMIASVIGAGHEAVGKLGQASGNNDLLFFAHQHGQSNADTTYDGLMNTMIEFLRPDIAAVTSTGELDFEAFAGDRQIILALRFPEGVRRTKGVQSMFVTSFLSWIVECAAKQRSGALPRPISLVLDEFASALERLPSMERAIHTLRSRDVSITAAVQSLSQIGTVYGEQAASVLAGFNNMVFIPQLEMADAEYASSLTGIMMAEAYTAAGSAQVITETRTIARSVIEPLQVGIPTRHPQWGNLATMILHGNIVLQAAMPPVWAYPGLEHWDRTAGGGYPSSVLPAREHPLPLHSDAFFSMFGAKPPSSSNVLGRLPQARVEARLREARQRLGWLSASSDAKDFWTQIEARHSRTPSVTLKFAYDLLDRAVTIDDLLAAHRDAKTHSLAALLHYLNYLKVLEHERNAKK